MTHRPDLADILLQAAERLVRERSLSAVTLDAAANLAGVGVEEARAAFADDGALRRNLVQFYHAANREVLAFALRDVDTVEDFVRQAQHAVENYYQIFQRDPDMRDVWTEILTDREMRNYNVVQVTENAGLVCLLLRELLPHLPEAELTATVELMIHMTDVAARWAAARDADKGRAMLDAFCRLISLMAGDLLRLDHERAFADASSSRQSA
ncbi:hypothetical protein [Zavarzinia sp.]|uniref:hypothetical protein n=1 Tax=Zavarzinia sp. TaxID=2027920 RepID=UPI003BB71089